MAKIPNLDDIRSFEAVQSPSSSRGREKLERSPAKAVSSIKSLQETLDDRARSDPGSDELLVFRGPMTREQVEAQLDALSAKALAGKLD